jgi:type IV pilus assembly protein PilP
MEEETKEENKKPEEAKETITAKIAAYVYDPVGKPDPFQSFIAEQEAMEEEKEEKKPKTYLETLDISQLDLIAVIIGPKENWAMVRDAKGMGYTIKAGTPIGINDGVVHQIKEREVVIREKYRDFRRGRFVHRDVSKKLPSLRQ